MSLRVGLIDSGLGPEHRAAASVRVTSGAFEAVQPDASGHGADMARIVKGLAPDCQILLAQVFDENLTSTPARIAVGLGWCTGEGARVVLMSLGLTRDDPHLREACDAASSAGIDLVASAPPRGGAVYPAAYANVIAVCGDIRCAPGEVSALGGTPAEFGACHVFGARSGASCAAASVAGMLAAWRAAGGAGDARDYLRSIARYHGREQRLG